MKKVLQSYFVYKLVHPITFRPYYVGVTKNMKARYSAHCSSYILKTTKAILSINKKPIIIEVEECFSLKLASLYEKKYIQQYSKHFELDNQNSGGYGKMGRKKLKDKKILVRMSRKHSEIEALGGHDALVEKINNYLDLILTA